MIDNSPSPSLSPPPAHPVISTRTKGVVVLVTILRIVLILNPLPSWITHIGPIEMSILDPRLSIQNLRETQFLLDMGWDGNDGHQGFQSLSQPLLLLLFGPILHNDTLIGLLLLLVDVLIAVAIYSISQRWIILNRSMEDRDVRLEKSMDDTIRPVFLWVFGITLPPAPPPPSWSQLLVVEEEVIKISETDGNDEIGGGTENETDVAVSKDNVDATTAADEKDSVDNNAVDKEANSDSEATTTVKNAQPANGATNDTNVKLSEYLKSLNARQSQHRRDAIIHYSSLPICASMLYYCNPVSILASSSLGSLANIGVMCYLTCLWSAIHGQVPLTMFALASSVFTSATDWWNCLDLIIPFVLLINVHSRSSSLTRTSVMCVVFYGVWVVALLGILQIADGTSTFQLFQSQSPQPILPNMGIRWYFDQQMFVQYKAFFDAIFNVLPLCFGVPLAVRLWRYPMEMATILYIVHVLYSPTVTLYNTSAIFPSLILGSSPRTLARARCTSLLVCIVSLPMTIILILLNYWMWMSTNAGNPNYMWFQCLAYMVFWSLIMQEFLMAVMKRDKALRMTEKLMAQAAEADGESTIEK